MKHEGFSQTIRHHNKSQNHLTFPPSALPYDNSALLHEVINSPSNNICCCYNLAGAHAVITVACLGTDMLVWGRSHHSKHLFCPHSDRYGTE